MLKTITDFLKTTLGPTCLLCSARTHRPLSLCRECENDLPWLHQQCRRCSLPLPAVEGVLCGACQKQIAVFDYSYALWQYQEPIAHLITRLKFCFELNCAQLFGELLAACLSPLLVTNLPRPQCLMPVPLHPNRLRERGFNQALEIARPISKQLAIPIIQPCIRTQNTLAQSSIPAKHRRQNVKKVFRLVQAVPYKHVAIIDDVMTTGATLGELAKVLKQAGSVETVSVWCCARTLIPT